MWDIGTTTEMLRDISGADGPGELLRLIVAHTGRNTQLERAVVLSREGLEYPFFRVMFKVASDIHDSSGIPEANGPVRAGGLLADLLYAGAFRSVSPLPGTDSDPASDLLAGAKSLVAFPLFDRGDQSGMVVMLAPVPHSCHANELCVLAIMGALLQRANRADLLAQQLKDACRALDSELASAADVQRWLLPPPAPPSTGVSTAALYRTAQRSGGDYYDTGPLPDGRFGVMIADVSGHGAAAAVLMAILRTIVHDEVEKSPVAGPAALLDDADDHLCTLGLSSRGAFVTAFSGALNTNSGEFCFSCAGHPPPRLIRSNARSVVPLDDATTQPLGVLDVRTPRTEGVVLLSPGDMLVFYSDGITEARSPTGEFFGIDGLDRILSQLPMPHDPEAAVAAIEEAVESFSGAATPLDDQTLLAVRWNGHTTSL